MKLLLKLLFSFGILVVAVYVASPWWIPQVLARQLPPGFQLENLETSYPGLSGIHINVLGVKAEFSAFSLILGASNIHFSYKNWKTDIASVSLDVHMRTSAQETTDSFTLSDLSLPIANLTGHPPQVSVRELKLALHHDMDFEPGGIIAGEPLVLNLQEIKLQPQTGHAFQLNSILSSPGTLDANGRLDIEVNGTTRELEVRFPATANSIPWFSLSIRQADREPGTTTNVQAVLDAGADDLDWLDLILDWGSAGRLGQLDGQLEVHAQFSGKEQQDFEYLSLTANHLQASSDEEQLGLTAKLLVKRDAETIIVSIPEATEIQYEDHADRINTLMEDIVPGLKLQAAQTTSTHVVFDANSNMTIYPGADPVMTFSGDLNLEINSPGSHLDLYATDFQTEASNLSTFDPTTASGLITIELEESDAFTYTDGELDLKVDEMALSIELKAGEGLLTSNGSATLTGAQIASMATSATNVHVSWRQLDLLTLVGEVQTKTQGFTTDVDAETWSGFDFDIGFKLAGNSDIKGSGTVNFDNGIHFPVEFEGNTLANKWNIALLPSSVKLAQFDGLLRAAHLKLPEPIELTGGQIDLAGNVLADSEITARLAIDGYEMSASVLESSARNVNFSLDTTFGNTVSANGPISIEVIELAGGIEVNNVRLELNLKYPESIGLQNLSADVFDGQLNLGSLRYSDNRIEDTTIKLNHIDLGHLLAFADIDGLEGTGLLTFSLPAGSDEKGVFIRNGTFISSSPGHLAYRNEGVADRNIGLQALENFQYTELSGTVDYQSDGTYKLGIRLKGNNPDLYGGHPINFNLNISGSLPELFEALFITGDFEESILKQIGIN